MSKKQIWNVYNGIFRRKLAREYVAERVKVFQVSDEEIKVDKRKSQITERLFSIKSIYMGFGIGLLILVAVFVWKMLPIDEQNDLSLNITPGNAIAVLPLKDISPEQQFEYFSEGITWEIHNNLVMIGGLVVRSRPSVEQYRNTEKDITTIGKELNSSYILSGSVQKYLDEFRVIIQLINVATNETIWSKPYGGSYNTETIFDMQINIAREVASSLRTSLTDKDEERISFRWTNNIESYDYSIRGQHEMNNYWLKHDREHLNNALESFNKALEIDPKNTRALGGKVQVFTYLPNSDSVDFYLNKLSNLDPNLGSFLWLKADNFLMTYQYDLALEYYKKTVDFFPDDPQANVELGEIYFNYEKDIESGLKHFNLALKGAFKSTERYPFVFHKIGYSLLNAGDYERAKCYFLEAWENGAQGEVWHYQWTLAVQQKHKEAYAFLDTICYQTKDELVCFWGKIFHCITQRDYTNAEQYYKVFNDKGYEANIWLQLPIACMYMNTGRKNEADLILEDCLSKLKKELEKYGETWHNALLLSELFAIKDDKDKALEYLSKAVDFGVLWGWQDMIEFSPVYENLWDESEFKALVQRAKDEKAAIRAQIQEMEENGEIDLSL